MQNDAKLFSFDDLAKVFNCDCGGACNFCIHHLPDHSQSKTRCLLLNSLKPVDAVPVVHGRWEFVSGEHLKPHFRCSACSRPRYEHYATNDFKFCPNCGAKMDGGAEG